MVRILGTEIPDNKKVWISLTYIYGIGKNLSFKILNDLNIDKEKLAKDLTLEEREKIKEYIEKNNIKTEGKLKEEIIFNIKRLKEIKSWRGLRHIKGLPVRGQQTRTNTRTIRGNIKRTVATARKPPPSPK